MPTQSSRNSVPFSTLITNFVENLTTYFTDNAIVAPVVVTTIPESDLATYQAQDGVLVHVSTPLPFPRCGAGRYGRRVVRYITCVILTQSLSDAAGSDITALTNHTIREEAIEDAVDLLQGQWLVCDWVNGGEDIVRQIKTDIGMMKSALRFRIEYISPETVTVSP